MRHWNDHVNDTDTLSIHYEKDNYQASKFKICVSRFNTSNDFAEYAPVQKGNSLYFFAMEKIDEEIEFITWMAYLHRVRLDKLDQPEENDEIIKSFRVSNDMDSKVISCSLITNIDEETVIDD